jgi:hypothetical protein
MAHEDFSREQHVEGSSNRAFGLVFAAVFLLIGIWPAMFGDALRGWALVVAAAFALIAWIRPELLAGANRLWMKLGILLGKLVAPVALAILFYGVFTPLGAVLRLAGKDPLRQKGDPSTRSYWLPREPPGPPRDSMTNQF